MAEGIFFQRWLKSLGQRLAAAELNQCRKTIEDQERQLAALRAAHRSLQGRLLHTEQDLTQSIRERLAEQEEHRRETASLRAQIGHDDLTGLLRRDAATRAFRRHASEGDRRTKRIGKGVPGYQVSVLFIDIDHFKQVNDRYGHAMGDQVLVAVAGTVRGLLRESDIPSRRGGEELVVILDNASTEEAATSAERIRQAVAAIRLPLAQDRALSVTVSIGVARIPLEEYPDNPDEALEQGIRWADMAMYEAKAHGRNRTITSPE